MPSVTLTGAAALSDRDLQKQPAPVDLFERMQTPNDASLNRHGAELSKLAMRKVEDIGNGRVRVDGRTMINLSSNNYLGLAGDRRMIESSRQAIKHWGTSTSGSRLLNGTNDLHIELEELLRAFKQAESVILFPSGYMANLGVISAILRKDDIVIIDKLVHASVIDGCRLAGAKIRMFPHQDLAVLERILKSLDTERGKLVALDGVYSMDGDFAKLPEITKLAHRYGARVLVDDAHGTGVAGPEGQGTASHFGLDEPDIVTGTLSKALGGIGGFVATRNDVAEYIKFNARSFIYSTSCTPSNTAALIKAMEIIDEEPERRENLWKCTHHMLDGLRSLGFNTGVSETPIVTVVLDDEVKMAHLVAGLEGAAIFASPVIYPACPKHSPRVRLSLTSNLVLGDIDQVLDSFQRLGKSLGLLSEGDLCPA